MGKMDCVTIAFIEEIVNQIAGVTASPGFLFGRSGTCNSGTYLLSETVPSNTTGILVPLLLGEITKVFVSNENTNTFAIEVVKHLGGGSFSVLATVSLTSLRTKVETFSGVSVVEGDEIGCRISSGSCKNVKVGIIIKGTNA